MKGGLGSKMPHPCITLSMEDLRKSPNRGLTERIVGIINQNPKSEINPANVRHFTGGKKEDVVKVFDYLTQVTLLAVKENGGQPRYYIPKDSPVHPDNAGRIRNNAGYRY